MIGDGFANNHPQSLNVKWSYENHALANYKKVMVIGSGQTGYMLNCFINHLTGTLFYLNDCLIASSEAINTLGNSHLCTIS